MNKCPCEHNSVHIVCGVGFIGGKFVLVLSILQCMYVHTRTLCVCIGTMERLEVWQHSGTTSNDLQSLGWCGAGRCPSCHHCVNPLYSVSVCGALGAVAGSSSAAGLEGSPAPPPRAVSHAPAPSLSTQFKRQS